jgi:hypothetical protein
MEGHFCCSCAISRPESQKGRKSVIALLRKKGGQLWKWQQQEVGDVNRVKVRPYWKKRNW